MFRPKDLLGIEIGNQYLKIIHINNKQEILNWTSTDIRALNDDGIIDFIRDYIQAKKIKSVEVINHIPAGNTITKNIELPSTNAAEIKQIIKLQAAHYSPYSPDEITIDYIPIDVFRGGYTRVFLIIVNRDYINRSFDIIERAGLKLKKMVLSLETMALWYKDKGRSEDKSWGLLHLDADKVDLMVIRQQKPIFLRNIPLGVEQLLFDRETYLPKLLEEITHSLESFQTEQLESLSKIVAIGATSKLTEVLRVIQEKNNLTVGVEDNFEGLKISPTIQDIKQTVTDTSVFSLAVSVIKYNKTEIDLTPEQVKLRQTVAEKSHDIIWMGVFLFFMLILLISVLAEKIWMKKMILTTLTQEHQKYHTGATELNNKKRKLQQVKKHFSRRDFALNVLTEIHKSISDEIYLTGVVFNDERQPRVTIRGIANINADILQMVERLEKSTYFKDVKSNYATGRRETIDRLTGKTREVVDFEIVCGFEQL